MLGRWITRLHNSRKILGMNARNLSYLKPYNKRSAIERVDDKIRFKRVLEKNDIPTPSLLGSIHSYQDLREFSFEDLPSSFVLKPASGFGGEGIVVIYGERKRKEDEERTWVRNKGDYFPQSRITNHVSNILDGSFSRTNTPDTAFFEERIKMTKFFRPLAYKGIPDIRVVVFNSTPVMAMLRLPTRNSSGAANLHAGGVGVGIDIALDRDKGPVVLEANARPGLAVQIANLAPLKERLEKVEGLKVSSVKRGIRIAQDLFGGEIEEEVEEITGRTVIGLTQEIMLVGNDSNTRTVSAKVDTGADSSSIDSSLVEELGYGQVFQEFENLNLDLNQPYHKLNEESNKINKELQNDTSKLLEKVVIVRSGNGFTVRPYIKISTTIEGRTYTNTYSITDRSNLKYPVLLGKRNLKNFLVDPNKR